MSERGETWWWLIADSGVYLIFLFVGGGVNTDADDENYKSGVTHRGKSDTQPPIDGIVVVNNHTYSHC